MATRAYTGQAENPGTFTSSTNDGWVAITILVRNPQVTIVGLSGAGDAASDGVGTIAAVAALGSSSGNNASDGSAAMTKLVGMPATGTYLRNYQFEGNSDEADITTSSAGPGEDNWDAINEGGPLDTYKYDNAFSVLGGFSGRSFPGTGTSAFGAWNVVQADFPDDIIAGRVFFRLDAYPTISATEFVQFVTSGGQAGALLVNTSGKLELVDKNGSVMHTSTTSLPLDEWMRIEFRAKVHNTAGWLEAKIYLTDIFKTTPDETVGDQVADETLRFPPITVVRFGFTGGGGDFGNIWMDGISLRNDDYPVLFPFGNNVSDGSGILTVTGGTIVGLSGAGDAASGGTNLLRRTLALSGAGDQASDGSTPTLRKSFTISGAGDQASEGSAAFTVLVPLSGSGHASSDARAQARVTKSLSGHGDAASGGTNVLTTRTILSGSGNAASGGTNPLRLTLAMSGAGDQASDGSGPLTTLRIFGASEGNAASDGAGTLKLVKIISGAGDSASDGQAILTTRTILSGHGDAASDGSAVIRPQVFISGAGDAASDGSGVVTVAGQVLLSGAGDQASDGGGTLTTLIALSGSGHAASGGTNLMRRTLAFSGSGNNAAETSAPLTIVVLLSGHGDAASDTSSPLRIIKTISGQGDAASAGSAILTALVVISGTGPNASESSATVGVARLITGAGNAASDGSALFTVYVRISGPGNQAADGLGTLMVTGAGIALRMRQTSTEYDTTRTTKMNRTAVGAGIEGN
jgi:hypothetical protein